MCLLFIKVIVFVNIAFCIDTTAHTYGVVQILSHDQEKLHHNQLTWPIPPPPSPGKVQLTIDCQLITRLGGDSKFVVCLTTVLGVFASRYVHEEQTAIGENGVLGLGTANSGVDCPLEAGGRSTSRGSAVQHGRSPTKNCQLSDDGNTWGCFLVWRIKQTTIREEHRQTYICWLPLFHYHHHQNGSFCTNINSTLVSECQERQNRGVINVHADPQYFRLVEQKLLVAKYI